MRAPLTPAIIFSATLVAVLSTAATPPPAAAAQPKPKALRLVVIEGEDAVNIIQQKTAVAPIVEVRDENDLPVAGVPVTFTVAGNTASFAGAQTITVTSNAAGRAAATGFTPLGSGSVQVNVSAAFQGQTATAAITQTNVATAAQAAQAGQSASSGGSSSGATTAAGGGAGAAGGLSTLAIVGIAGGAAAGGLVAINAASGGDDAPEARNTPPTVSGITASTTNTVQGTTINFTAQASDAENNPLTYSWEFGDGGTATQPAPSYTYRTAGTFMVRVTVSDGQQSASTQTTVTIWSMTGTWRGQFSETISGDTLAGEVVVTLQQSDNVVTGNWVATNPFGSNFGPINGTLSGTNLTAVMTPQIGACTLSFTTPVEQSNFAVTTRSACGTDVRFTVTRQ